MRQGSAARARHIGRPLGDISAPENCVGPKTYSKGHPGLIARLQVHVSGVWRLFVAARHSTHDTSFSCGPSNTAITNHRGNLGMFAAFALTGVGMRRRMFAQHAAS
jgi:hypothetical protein